MKLSVGDIVSYDGELGIIIGEGYHHGRGHNIVYVQWIGGDDDFPTEEYNDLSRWENQYLVKAVSVLSNS
jgi:hypothetical protein